MANVLVTGAAGAVGQPVCAELGRRGHHVRGFDRIVTPGVPDGVVADTTDAVALQAAAAGCDMIIHLAAEANDRDFVTGLVAPNVVGPYNVLHGAREAQVPRVVLASSLQVAPQDLQRPARVDESAPTNHYALTKLWAEQMGEMYARCFGLNVLCARLNWMVRNPAEARHMERVKRPDIYISPGDVARFFSLAVEVDWTGFAVVYAAGAGSDERFDLEPARRLLGYVPQDRWPAGLPFTYGEDDDAPDSTTAPALTWP
ncbi:MAG: NAD(P)-dependent oxidoreductase [Deltaproteobacteria bacterium]|nr:NAD(P)-dependent oxidoreductase [Deltaproteobacteria bacterium]